MGAMDSGQCSRSSADDDDGLVWAKLVPDVSSGQSEVEIRVGDPVVCSAVEASANSEKLAWCEIARRGEAASFRKLSSRAIIVDGNAVGEESVDIKDGSKIILGPAEDGCLCYTFEVIPTANHDTNNIQIMLDVEHAKCSICLNVWHDVVTVSPCFHNFCNGCFSEWMRRSSVQTGRKLQDVVCPQCRGTAVSVGKNHFLRNIEEAILQASASLKRSKEEIALLETYASVKSNFSLKSQSNKSRKRTAPDYRGSPMDIPCPQCGSNLGGFQCGRGTAHLQCRECGGLMPSRTTAVPQHCLGCERAFCAAYWQSQGVTSDAYNLICDLQTFMPIRERTISEIPESVHQRNPYEQDITRRCIEGMGKTLQGLIAEWVTKFENKEIDQSRLLLKNGESITSESYTCKDCYDKLVDFLLYWFRWSLSSNLLPRDAAGRQDCWYGYLCRTQRHSADHARKLNHVCPPTLNTTSGAVGGNL